jgi:hypothetical protein
MGVPMATLCGRLAGSPGGPVFSDVLVLGLADGQLADGFLKEQGEYKKCRGRSRF